MSLEQISSTPLKDPGKVEAIGANTVQAILMEEWAKKKGLALQGNELVLEWIKVRLAQSYREYADTHADQVIDLSDEKELASLLEKIEITIH